MRNGCEYKCDSSGYATKSECIDKCKSWFCEATGCERKEYLVVVKQKLHVMKIACLVVEQPLVV